MANNCERCADCGSPMGLVNGRLVCCDCTCTKVATDSERVMQDLWRDLKGIDASVSLSERGYHDDLE